MRLGAALIDYIGALVLSGGDRDGEAFKVLPWERRFLIGAFGQPGHAALSVARGNGKSALVAGIAAAVVDPDGPMHGNRREAVAVASSFDQGGRSSKTCSGSFAAGTTSAPGRSGDSKTRRTARPSNIAPRAHGSGASVRTRRRRTG